MRPSRCSMSAGRHGASRWCKATRRFWTLVPSPIFGVLPRRMRTLPSRTCFEERGFGGVVVVVLDEGDLCGRECRGRSACRARRHRRRSHRLPACGVERSQKTSCAPFCSASSRARLGESSRRRDSVLRIRVVADVRDDEPKIERGFAAFGRDLEHVVVARIDLAALDLLGALDELIDEALQLRAWPAR